MFVKFASAYVVMPARSARWTMMERYAVQPQDPPHADHTRGQQIRAHARLVPHPLLMKGHQS